MSTYVNSNFACFISFVRFLRLGQAFIVKEDFLFLRGITHTWQHTRLILYNTNLVWLKLVLCVMSYKRSSFFTWRLCRFFLLANENHLEVLENPPFFEKVNFLTVRNTLFFNDAMWTLANKIVTFFTRNYLKS